VERAFHIQEGTMNTEQLSHVELEFREGSSDKIYRAAIERVDDGFVVNFGYGRRGATLNTGTKTANPVPYDQAADIYQKLVRAKTAKGYKPVAGGHVDAGIGSSITDREQRDTGLRPQLLNPITEDEAESYLDDDNWCAQEKFDGKRMLLRKSGREITAANRNGLSIGFPDALVEPLSRYGGGLAACFAIDGESVSEIYFVFDLLESTADDWRKAPYKDRLEALQSQFGKLGGNIVVATTAIGEKKR
jgi:bifunctional non-homologous end joining protein LigD